MTTIPLYVALARKLAWEPTSEQFVEQRRAEIERLRQLLPSGSGWDMGTKIEADSHTADKRIHLFGSFHHMNEHGSYDGWTDHSIVVTPSLSFGFALRITGVNRNDIKDYLHELFDHALRQEVSEYLPTKGDD